MRTIHVRVGHDDDAVVAQFLDVVIFFANASTQSGDQCHHLLTGKHFVKTGFFDVEDFTFERQNRLVFTVSPLFGRTARRVTLDDKYFRQAGIFFLTIGEFTWQTHSVQHTFAARHFTRTTCGVARTCGLNNFVTNDFGFVRTFLQKVMQRLTHDFFHRQTHFGRDQFVFGLRGKFRLRYFDGQYAGETFAHVIARGFDLGFFSKVIFLDVFIDYAGHRGAQASQMRTAVALRNIIGKAQYVFVVRVIPLHGDFDRNVVFLTDRVKYFRVQYGFAAIDVLHKSGNPAAKRKVFFFIGTQVDQTDFHTVVQE